eukprot:CAMPEP_0176355532 /NCGR_PEP_ID=MMETSP0126-20121128/13359_1 /TAXON_ID=141414 ORGANISM="Strombidinopsis acuminatum, Strain SPMC142" /NCGR_SAMPLE_ID=MMETSP0126 /ASSEMBLY_ACC=CAM_ASM_000229 /LENGTH=79 /DNA_ID=CAMNT_0017708217 /DNA_START=38 /DNA_END=277 /DNA_ORIENTATION=-
MLYKQAGILLLIAFFSFAQSEPHVGRALQKDDSFDTEAWEEMMKNKDYEFDPNNPRVGSSGTRSRGDYSDDMDRNGSSS